jgi:hypothetical protein
VNTNAQNERVFIELYDPSVTSWNASTYCKPTSPPKLEEYHVMVKKGRKVFTFVHKSAKRQTIKTKSVVLVGYESQAAQPCPPSLIGRFTYTHDTGTSQTCSSSSSLAVCPSWSTMTFNYTKCATEQAFSSNFLNFSLISRNCSIFVNRRMFIRVQSRIVFYVLFMV